MSSCFSSPNVTILDIVIVVRDLIDCLSCGFRNFVSIQGTFVSYGWLHSTLLLNFAFLT